MSVDNSEHCGWDGSLQEVWITDSARLAVVAA